MRDIPTLSHHIILQVFSQGRPVSVISTRPDTFTDNTNRLSPGRDVIIYFEHLRRPLCWVSSVYPSIDFAYSRAKAGVISIRYISALHFAGDAY
jgi:hypothetical protein